MEKLLSFAPHYTRLEEILNDKNLAQLGDAYVNFIYSIALSKKKDKATGVKASSRLLAQALKKAGLRQNLSRRMDRHALGDAAEALIVYGWIHGTISIEESLTTLTSTENTADAFANLLRLTEQKLSL